MSKHTPDPENHQRLVDYIVEYMSDGWEGESWGDKAWLVSVVEEVLLVVYHAEELKMLERRLGNKCVRWLERMGLRRPFDEQKDMQEVAGLLRRVFRRRRVV